MRDRLIELISNKINDYYTCYTEEAPSTATFPYLVIPIFKSFPIEESGFSCTFDIEVYINELSNISFESIVDTLRDNLDGYFYRDDTIGFHLGYETDSNYNSTEQDLVIRTITFTARIFR